MNFKYLLAVRRRCICKRENSSLHIPPPKYVKADVKGTWSVAPISDLQLPHYVVWARAPTEIEQSRYIAVPARNG